MKLKHSFTVPEEPPIVPTHLQDRLLDFLPASKINIMISQTGGWKLVNAISLGENEEPLEVVAMVKHCADHHAAENGQSAKYRAEVWRNGRGRDADRNYITFLVRAPCEGEEYDGMGGGEAQLRSQWYELYRAQQEFNVALMSYNKDATRWVLESSKARDATVRPMGEVIQELIVPYRDGLEMQRGALARIADARVKQEVAEAQNDGIWSTFAPAFTEAAKQITGKLVGSDHRAIPERTGKSEPKSSGSSEHSNEVKVQSPKTLHEFGRMLVNSFDGTTLCEAMDILTPEQGKLLRSVAKATDDDTTAIPVVHLMQSLMKTPAILLQLSELLGDSRAAALKKLATISTRYLQAKEKAAG